MWHCAASCHNRTNSCLYTNIRVFLSIPSACLVIFISKSDRYSTLPSFVSGPEVLRTLNFSVCLQFHFHNSDFHWHSWHWYQWCIVMCRHTYSTAACCQHFLLPKKSIKHFTPLLHFAACYPIYCSEKLCNEGNIAVAWNICCNQFQAGWLVISHNLTHRNRRLQKITFRWATPLGISSFIHMCKCSCILCY